MMDAQLERKLIECLTLIDEGEPIERILARFPEDAARLRPMLETVGLIQRLPADPDPGAQRASRRAFLNQAAELRDQQARRPRWLPSRLVASLAAVLVVLFMAGGAAAASQQALPGSALYSVKRAVETAGLLLAPQGDKAALAASFDQRRRDEVRALLSSGREAEVRFTGAIESLTPGQWLVAGIPVGLNAATSITGTPAVGARAEVQGITSGGQVAASFITIDVVSVPAPTATPNLVSTATAVATPTQPAAIATPTALAATATPSAEPSEQASTKAPLLPSSTPIVPTATSVPLPSATPVPPSPVPPTPVPPSPVPPTAAPAPPTEFEFSGTVERIGSTWQISGQIVEIDGSTEIRDTINIGTRVKVRALRYTDGRVVARRIERDNSGSGSGDGNNNGNDNSGGGGGGGGSDDNGNNGNDNSGGGGGNGDNSGSGGGGGGGGGDDKNNDNSGHGGGGGDDNKNDSGKK